MAKPQSVKPKTSSLRDFIIAARPICPVCESKHAAEVNAVQGGIEHNGKRVKLKYEDIARWLCDQGVTVTALQVRAHFKNGHV